MKIRVGSEKDEKFILYKKNVFPQKIHMDTWNAILTNAFSDKERNLFR